jgi:predicted MFS family arabinose efflux permease
MFKLEASRKKAVSDESEAIYRSQTGPQKLWNFNYIYFLCLSALNSIGFFMVNPILPKYIVGIGSNLVVAGIISGLFSITALVVRPFSGAAVDRFNKKRLMVISTAIIGLSVFTYSVTSNITAIFIIRIIHGTAFAISGTTNIAFASSFIPEDRMGEGVGYLGLGHIAATAIGPNAGLWVYENFGYKYCFTIAAILSLLTASLMLVIKYSSPKKQKLERKKLRFSDLIAVELLPFAVFAALFSLSNGLVSTFIALLGESRGIENVGIFFTTNAIFLLIARLFAGKLNDRKGLSVIMIPAYILAATAMTLLAGASALWMIALAGALKALGQGGGQPALQAECIKKLGRDRTGVATSTYYIGADVGQGLGPIIGGAVSTSFGYGTMYAGCACLLAVGLVMYLIYAKRQKRSALKIHV